MACPTAYERVRAAAAQTPTGDDASLVTELLFSTLPRAVQRATGWGTPPSSLRLLSDHYVVKPPHSESGFRWHRDADRQLAQLVARGTSTLGHVDDNVLGKRSHGGRGGEGQHAEKRARLPPAFEEEEAEAKEEGEKKGEEGGEEEEEEMRYEQALASIPYASTWLPLEPTTIKNGTLVLIPWHSTHASHHHHSTEGLPAKHSDDQGLEVSHAVPVVAQPGDVCVFSSMCWHASGANTTSRPRRVHYCQYSREAILWPHDAPGTRAGQPLWFAVPCHAGET